MALSKEQFVEMLWPAAQKASEMTGIDPRIIIAQAAQETGWGRSAPGNNYFGIKSHGKGGGQNFTTHEVINGKRVKIRDNFRQYEDPADSVMGYAEFMLENPRYKPLREADGLDAQLQALGASGYATDPNYARSVGSIARNLPIPASSPQISPEAQQFVDRNPQPGGYGPGVDDPNAPQAPAPQQVSSAPPLPPPQTIGSNPVTPIQYGNGGGSEPPAGLLASLGAGAEKINPLLSMLAEEQQPVQMMPRPQAAAQMPSLADYIGGFLQSRLS